MGPRDFPGSSRDKNLPAMWNTWVRSLGWEDAPEKGMETHSGILAWKIPTDRGACWATVHGVTESDTTARLNKNNKLQKK